MDSLSFNADGSIQKVIPTLRGAGISNAKKEIQIDRYSKIGEQAAISFIDTTDTFKGWKTKFTEAGAWVQYNTVDFGSQPSKKLMFKVLAEQDAILEIRTGSLTGPLLSKVDIKKTSEWMVVGSDDIKKITGIQNLFVVLKEGKGIEIDWLRFE
jgi:hypothetical protein